MGTPLTKQSLISRVGGFSRKRSLARHARLKRSQGNLDLIISRFLSRNQLCPQPRPKQNHHRRIVSELARKPQKLVGKSGNERQN